jgi:hypothetical protein
MSEAETETETDGDTETNGDPIVLEAPFGIASVGAVPEPAEGESEGEGEPYAPEDDPELGNGIREISSPTPDPEPDDPSRVIDLPQPESARESGTQEFEVQDAAFARGLLKSSPRIKLVENPRPDVDLSGLLTRKQKRARYRQKKYKEKQRNKGTDFDPRADNPRNTKQSGIKDAYEDLVLFGEDVAAAQLRGLTDTSKQKSFVQSLKEAEVLSQ